MKRIFVLLLCALLLAGCGGKTGESGAAANTTDTVSSTAGDGAGDGGILLLGRLGAVGPSVGAAGPAHPHAILRGELGGHKEAVGLGGGLGLGDRTHKISSKSNDRLLRAGYPQPKTKRW